MSQVIELSAEGEGSAVLLDSEAHFVEGPGFDGDSLHNQRRNTQGIKLHMLYERAQKRRFSVSLSPANVNDIRRSRRELTIESGRFTSFDKGYCDFNWWSLKSTRQAFALSCQRFKKILL